MKNNGRNQVIDGWRGTSIILVVVGHTIGFRIGNSVAPIKDVLGSPIDLFINLLSRVAGELGEVGVELFFVISGYLITSLLSAEEAKRGNVSFKAFYVRRIFRISPAFYIYLLAVLGLALFGPVIAEPDAFVRSGLYVCNFSGFECSWWLAHTWSLSVEEQFYLCWPLLFVILGTRRKLGIALIAAILTICSIWYAEFSPFAHIAIGAAVALIDDLKQLLTRFASAKIVLLMALILLLKPLTFPFPAITAAIFILKPLLIAIMFFGTLFNMSCAPIRTMLSTRFLVNIGLCSYSLYLWQQISLAPAYWGGSETGAAALYADYPVVISLVFIPLAILSYRFLELPLIKVGHSMSNKILHKPS